MYFIYDKISNYNIDDYQFFYNNLNDVYKEKIKHLIHKKDKQLSILAQTLLSNIFMDKYFIDYKNTKIKYNKYGKPFVKFINYNIAHSNEYSIVAISNKRIGVDIEYIRKVDINTINYICTDNEKKYILNSKNKYKALFEIFCLKEAYFKMLGTGIINLKEIEFIINNNKIKCLQNNNINITLNYDINNYIIAIIEEKN